MVFITAVIMSVMLFILGCTILLTLNSNYLLDHLKNEIEIVIFMEPEASREEVQEIEPYFSYLTGLNEVTFVPKEDALTILGSEFKDTHLLKSTGGGNPLPDVYRIKIEDTTYLNPCVEFLSNKEQFPHVNQVVYSETFVERFLDITGLLSLVCMVAIGCSFFITLFLINNTIRITVSSRQDEIHIMKYIGATNWYIHLSFILEGLFIGFIGASISCTALYFGYQELVEYVAGHVQFLTLVYNTSFMVQIFIILILLGCFLGAFGSMLAVKKHLKV